MTFVLDCSATMPWVLHNDTTGKAQEVLIKLETEQAIVPEMWLLEVSNILLVFERRGRITTDESEEFVRFLGNLPIHVEEGSSRIAFREIRPLARKHGLTGYDATYLELAIREDLPIATLDKNLQQAAKRSGGILL